MNRCLNRVIVASIAFLAIGMSFQSTEAAIIYGEHVFDDNAFVDVVLEQNGQLSTWDTVATQHSAAAVEEAVIGPNLAGIVELGNANASGNVLLGFTDNVVVNGTGADLVLFEENGTSSRFFQESFRVSLTVAGLSTAGEFTYVDVQQLTAEGNRIASPNHSGWWHNVGYLDLSSLGVPDGATIDQIAITSRSIVVGGADLSAVGALHSTVIPEPTTLAIWAALIGLGLTSSRFRRRKMV